MKRLALVLIATDVLGIVVGIGVAVRHDAITEYSSEAVALAFLVGVLAAVVAWIARNARRYRVSLAAASTGIVAIVGTMRFLDLGATKVALSEAAWLACAPFLVALVIVTVTDRRPSPAATVPLGLSVLTVIVAAVIRTHGTGKAIAHGISIGADGPWTRGVIITNTLLLLAGVAGAGLALRGSEQKRGSPDPSSRALIRCAAAWLVIAVMERTLYLLSPTRLFDQSTFYRPWAVVVLVNFPLAAASMVLVAVAFVIIVQPRLRRAPDGTLVIDAADPASTLVRDLSSWVGDPSLRIAFTGPDGRMVDANGRAFSPRQGSASTALTRGGHAFAIIEHDGTLVDDDLVVLVGALTGGALDANAAIALTNARVIDQRRLAGRLLMAEATTRRQLLDDLERGPLARIEAISAQLGDPTSAVDVVGELRLATAEVRELSHGLIPAELIDGGLESALDRKSGVPQGRLPESVELTAWLINIADPELRFDQTSTSLVLHLSAVLTDQALLDRVEAIGGGQDGATITLPLVEGS